MYTHLALPSPSCTGDARLPPKTAVQPPSRGSSGGHWLRNAGARVPDSAGRRLQLSTVQLLMLLPWEEEGGKVGGEKEGDAGEEEEEEECGRSRLS